MKKPDKANEMSLCWNVWQQGWVTEEDYRDDVEQSSEMRVGSLRQLYYDMCPVMIDKAYESKWAKYLFFMASYFYIYAINGVDAFTERRLEMWKLVAWPPFIMLVIPAFCVGYVLYYRAGSPRKYQDGFPDDPRNPLIKHREGEDNCPCDKCMGYDVTE
jgi:hypothetical protein